MWRNPYSESIKFDSAVGSPIRPLYKADLGKDGQIILKEDGIDHVYDTIQSYKSSVDINIIMQRYAAGDPYVLEQRIGQYGDFTSVPSSYMDVLNAVVDLRTRYEQTKMDKPFNDFVSELLNPSDKVLKKAVENPVEKEVVKDEQKSE